MDISPMQMCNVLHLLLFYAWIINVWRNVRRVFQRRRGHGAKWPQTEAI